MGKDDRLCEWAKRHGNRRAVEMANPMPYGQYQVQQNVHVREEGQTPVACDHGLSRRPPSVATNSPEGTGDAWTTVDFEGTQE